MRKFINIKSISFITLFLFFTLPSITIAGGFPTFDLSADVRSLNKLKKLAEQLKIQTSQLEKLLKLERVAESKYNSYINQIKSAQRLFKRKDWYKIASIGIERFSKLREITEIDLKDDTKSKEIYQSFRFVPDSPDEFKKKMDDAGIKDYNFYAEDVEKDYETYMRAKDKYHIVSAYNIQAQETEKAIIETDEVLNSLGDESELATLQTIAVQNSIIIKQLAAIGKIQKNQFLTESSMEDMLSAKLAKSRSDEMERLKNKKEIKIPNLKGNYLANF